MELAMADGCDTAKDLATWYQGYLRGELAMIKSMKDELELPEIDVDEPTFEELNPDDEAYDKASSNAGELI